MGNYNKKFFEIDTKKLTQKKMGKQRRGLDKVEKIADPNVKKVTLCKRKRSLIKKAIELSIMCQ